MKRLVVGLYLGKKTYSKFIQDRKDRYSFTFLANYANDLTQIVKKVLMLSEIAGLARQCHIESTNSIVGNIARPQSISERVSTEQLRGLLNTDAQSHEDEPDPENRRREMAKQNTMKSSDRLKIRDLLGDWYVQSFMLQIYSNSNREDPELVLQNQVCMIVPSFMPTFKLN